MNKGCIMTLLTLGPAYQPICGPDYGPHNQGHRNYFLVFKAI